MINMTICYTLYDSQCTALWKWSDVDIHQCISTSQLHHEYIKTNQVLLNLPEGDSGLDMFIMEGDSIDDRDLWCSTFVDVVDGVMWLSHSMLRGLSDWEGVQWFLSLSSGVWRTSIIFNPSDVHFICNPVKIKYRHQVLQTLHEIQQILFIPKKTYNSYKKKFKHFT